MGLMRRVAGSTGGETAVVDPPWSKDSGVGELTWEFLTSTRWAMPPGPRRTGTVNFFCDAGKVKALLNDRDANLTAFVTLDPSKGLWEAVEEALLSTSTDWRLVQKQSQGKGR